MAITEVGTVWPLREEGALVGVPGRGDRRCGCTQPPKRAHSTQDPGLPSVGAQLRAQPCVSMGHVCPKWTLCGPRQCKMVALAGLPGRPLGFTPTR